MRVWRDIKTEIYFLAGLHEGFLSAEISLQLSQKNIQHFKPWNFFILFIIWGSSIYFSIRIQIQNSVTNPQYQLNPDLIESGSISETSPRIQQRQKVKKLSKHYQFQQFAAETIYDIADK